MNALATYEVTRLPGAAVRRAGRAWELGTTRADLTPGEVDILQDDPGYRVVPVPAQDAAPKPKRIRT
jgi:hypothetical protein